MKFGVVTFPGSNCDQDMIYVLESIVNQEVVSLWHKDHDLQGCDFIVLPGGFSYGDYFMLDTNMEAQPNLFPVYPDFW